MAFFRWIITCVTRTSDLTVRFEFSKAEYRYDVADETRVKGTGPVDPKGASSGGYIKTGSSGKFFAEYIGCGVSTSDSPKKSGGGVRDPNWKVSDQLLNDNPPRCAAGGQSKSMSSATPGASNGYMKAGSSWPTAAFTTGVNGSGGNNPRDSLKFTSGTLPLNP